MIHLELLSPLLGLANYRQHSLVLSFPYRARVIHWQHLRNSLDAKPLFLNNYYLQVFQPSTMCFKVVERFSVCGCLYFQHAVDPCEAYGQRGHAVQEKVVLVGYTCEKHTARRSGTTSRGCNWPDSSYSSKEL
jgi:hypothetical protein